MFVEILDAVIKFVLKVLTEILETVIPPPISDPIVKVPTYAEFVEILFVETLLAVIKFVLNVLDIDTNPPKVALPVTVRVLFRVVAEVTFNVLFTCATPVTVKPFSVVAFVTLRVFKVVVPALRVLMLAVAAPSKLVLRFVA